MNQDINNKKQKAELQDLTRSLCRYEAAEYAEKEPLKKTITLPMFGAGTPLQLYSDDALLNGSVTTIKQNKRQQLTITIPCNGGVVVTEVQ